ncbi:hypothetical protein p2A328 (plasmid) [Aromatoleum aromaticum EbN1]|uniref:Uncharacterized protein n=1 Tax=Aromatoleum aromaticum (strain DSM 19018 / LMG 30748 / EbN1) TaxID=76114 RepID=Q5NW80_AROAE|nr:hypothetical protein p2A328 [Aromatoleum aromaticum EbN1]
MHRPHVKYIFQSMQYILARADNTRCRPIFTSSIDDKRAGSIMPTRGKPPSPAACYAVVGGKQMKLPQRKRIYCLLGDYILPSLHTGHLRQRSYNSFARRNSTAD